MLCLLGIFRLPRYLLLAGLLGTAVAGPYLYTKGGKPVDAVSNWWKGNDSATTSNDWSLGDVPFFDDGKSSAPATEEWFAGETGPLPLGEVAPPQKLEDVLSFDMTINRIIRVWPNVSTGMSDLSLQGYRVPLVTGIRDEDVAGALTYYFGHDRRVQKITFVGTTGNADRLIKIVTEKYQLRHVPSPDANAFVFRRTFAGRTLSELVVRPRATLRADRSHQRFNVSLAILRELPAWRQSSRLAP